MINFDTLVAGPVMGIFGETASGSQGLPRYRFGGAGAGFDLADAVYDDSYLVVDENDAAPAINTSGPVLGVRLSLFSQLPTQNDTVYLPRLDETFRVNDVEPDGQGWALLKLTFYKKGQ